MRVALVHDWLTGMRGGEKVLRALCELLPGADIFTLFHAPGSCDPQIECRRIVTSWLNRLPGVGRYYRYLLPLMPYAIGSLDARAYDLVISCSHCVAKGIRSRPDALHVCYCLTPMRYLNSQSHHYSKAAGWPVRLGLRVFGKGLQQWDRQTANGVDLFLANSHNVSSRIARQYGRQAQVVYSPIDSEYFTPSVQRREDFFLVVGALVPYKRVDLAIAAFNRLGLPLRIIGSGPEMRRLRGMAAANVKLMGWQPDEVVRDHYRRCRALIFPGEEDFGLVPLEAMACGAPVIALRAGGACETVVDLATAGGAAATGILFSPSSIEALTAAVGQFLALRGQFQADQCVARARMFGKQQFLQGIREAISPLLDKRGLEPPW